MPASGMTLSNVEGAPMACQPQGLIGRGALRLWSTLWGLLRKWQAERTRAELRTLSDRTLADIGLTRPQIESLYR